MLGVGVERRVIAALNGLHFSHHPRRSLRNDFGVERLRFRQPQFAVQTQQRAVVVEHFFEVGYRPLAIDAVAAEAAAQLIVNPAFGHFGQRQSRHAQSVSVVDVGGAAQAEVELRGVRKLGCRADAAVGLVENILQLAQRDVERDARQRTGRRGRRQRMHEGAAQCDVLPLDFAALVAVRGGDLRQQVDKARHAMARRFWKIRAAEKRRLVGHQKHRERPAAVAPRQQCMRRLVYLVEIRALFAIDFDVDEQFVHQRGDRRILERFVRHHMTPVARGVADRQQHRLVLRARGCKRFCAPRIPVDRVGGMLLQVRARCVRESVGHRRSGMMGGGADWPRRLLFSFAAMAADIPCGRSTARSVRARLSRARFAA